MDNRLQNRLTHARRKRFMGRTAELELFRTALEQAVPDFAVLFLYGPGGVGKTTLLHEYARISHDAGRVRVALDGRNLDLSPTGFLTALQGALGLPPDASPLEALLAADDPVLILDTYELVTPLDGWLRAEFLPQLPARALVVIAGRHAPAAAWRADGDWGALTRIIALRNLRPDESQAYLHDRGLHDDEIAQVLGVTYGHPLALSLAADVMSQNAALRTFDLKRDPDIVRVLMERFVADVPNPVLRQALEVCAHALTTTEALLAHCLGEADAYAAFQWLRTLSFIEHGPFGLFPHDLVREVLEADLRWRNLDRFRDLHFWVRNHIIEQSMARSGLEQQYAIFALLFLHRNNPVMRPLYAWQSFGQLYIDKATPADLPAIEAMVLRHQGEEARRITHYWRERQPSSLFVFRGAENALVGFCQVLEIGQLAAADCATDPAAAAAATHMHTLTPLRNGDVVYYFRNWIDAEHYQNAPATFNMCAMLSLRLFFTTPKLAYSLISSVANEEYRQMFDYLRMPRAADAGFVMDGQPFDVYTHDWRTEPVLTWLEFMGEREIIDDIAGLDALPREPQPVVLSEPEFADAVRQALKDVRMPDRLAESPLLFSRVVRDQADEAVPATLQALLRAAAAALTGNPRDLKLHRVLWHTYFEPAASQEAAAELLDLPFSTYRYQLGKAQERVVAWLWRRELYGSE